MSDPINREKRNAQKGKRNIGDKYMKRNEPRKDTGDKEQDRKNKTARRVYGLSEKVTGGQLGRCK